MINEGCRRRRRCEPTRVILYINIIIIIIRVYNTHGRNNTRQDTQGEIANSVKKNNNNKRRVLGEKRTLDKF